MQNPRLEFGGSYVRSMMNPFHLVALVTVPSLRFVDGRIRP